MFSSYTVGESAALISPAVICERINGEREREREEGFVIALQIGWPCAALKFIIGE